MEQNKKLFYKIDIEINNLCTRKCIFCPKYKDERKEIIELPWESIHKIIQDLKNINYTGVIQLSNFNEPTTDKRLPEIIEYIHTELPKCYICFHSNGDVYKTPEQYVKLFENGLQGIQLNIYDESRKEFLTNIYNETKKLHGEEKFDKDLIGSNRFYFNSKKWISFILINNIEFVKKRKGKLNMQNRAGNLQWLVPNPSKPLYKMCGHPFRTMVVRSTGDVVVCCEDYYSEGVVGNINDDTLTNIWMCDKFQEIRKNLLYWNRNMIPCNKCDNRKQFMFYQIYNAWEELKPDQKKKNVEIIHKRTSLFN